MATKSKVTKVTSKVEFTAPREGSKKAAVFLVFTQKGRDEAIKYGRSAQHLKESSLVVWVNAWRRAGVKSPAPKAKAPAKAAVKATPVKKAA